MIENLKKARHYIEQARSRNDVSNSVLADLDVAMHFLNQLEHDFKEIETDVKKAEKIARLGMMYGGKL